jgi:hypothetical protein
MRPKSSTHEVVQASCFLLEYAEVGTAPILVEDTPISEQFRELPQRGQRAAELVGDRRHKSRLQLSGVRFAKHAAGDGVAGERHQEGHRDQHAEQVLFARRCGTGCSVGAARSRDVEPPGQIRLERQPGDPSGRRAEAADDAPAVLVGDHDLYGTSGLGVAVAEETRQGVAAMKGDDHPARRGVDDREHRRRCGHGPEVRGGGVGPEPTGFPLVPQLGDEFSGGDGAVARAGLRLEIAADELTQLVLVELVCGPAHQPLAREEAVEERGGRCFACRVRREWRQRHRQPVASLNRCTADPQEPGEEPVRGKIRRRPQPRFLAKPCITRLCCGDIAARQLHAQQPEQRFGANPRIAAAGGTFERGPQGRERGLALDAAPRALGRLWVRHLAGLELEPLRQCKDLGIGLRARDRRGKEQSAWRLDIFHTAA